MASRLAGLALVLLAAAAVFLAITLAPVMAAKSNEPAAEYMARARALAEAVDIAVKIGATRPDELSDDELGFWRVHVKMKALAPEPPFANLESLADLEDALFTYWNEAEGEHVDRFWRIVAERGLPFKRRDVVREVLKRGHIRDDVERQHVIDGLVILQQTGKISRQEADRLSSMLKQFEEREGKRQ
jgi:hypothetical protein